MCTMRAGLADTTVLHPFRLLRFHTMLLSPLGFPIRSGGVVKVLFSTPPAYSRDLTNAEAAHTTHPRAHRAPPQPPVPEPTAPRRNHPSPSPPCPTARTGA